MRLLSCTSVIALSIAIIGAASEALALDDLALPSGGQVTAGGAGLDYSIPGQLHVHQSTDRAVIDWDSFDIGRDALTEFHQPGSNSIVVNRVMKGTDPTRILGALRANGTVMVLNADGVIFGADSHVDVGGLVASTGELDTQAFMDSGAVRFSGIDNGGAIVNYGSISVADAGLAAFVAPTVANHGSITARLGRIQMGTGDVATLDLYGDGLLEVAVGDRNIQRAIDNTGVLRAEGGLIQISAAAAKTVVDGIVNLDGVISAASATVKGGKIILGGGNITVAESAVIDASSTAGDGGDIILYADNEAHIAGALSARGGSGGFIETSATDRVMIADSARIDTGGGTWLIDPTNFTIANSGGDITTAALAAQLALNNISIETASAGSDAGDIFVSNALSWTGNNTLTLRAHRNIEVNAAVTNTQGGSLVLRADKEGSGTGTVIFGGGGSVALSGGGRTDLYYNPSSYATPTNYAPKVTGTNTVWMLVNNVTQLQAMNTNVTGSYALGKDIDASATAAWNVGAGFVPINSNSGKFDGLGHTITGLTINRPTTDKVGLFYEAWGALIRNVGLVGVSITGRSYVGGLVGNSAHSTVSNVYVTGNVSGTGAYVGGLLGTEFGSTTVRDSYTSATVSGNSSVGGLVGWSLNTNTSAVTIARSYATGNVSGTAGQVGGLVGMAQDAGGIEDSYATGNVSGASFVGGLVGYVSSPSTIITNSYATGNVSGTANRVGGFTGYNGGTVTNSYATGNVSGTAGEVGGFTGYNGGTVTNSYATGNVSGTAATRVGGFIGHNGGTVTNSYATGNVTGITSVGGLIGYSPSGAVTNSYWNTQTSGRATSAGGTGLTTAQMMQMASFSGWSISNAAGSGTVWRIYEGQTAPLLASFLTPLTVTVDDVSIPYSGAPWGGGYLSYQGFKPDDDASDLLGAALFGGAAQGATEPGDYVIGFMGGLYSGQRGYDISISPVPGKLTIGAKPLLLPVAGLADSQGQLRSMGPEIVPPVTEMPDEEIDFSSGAGCLVGMDSGLCVLQ